MPIPVWPNPPGTWGGGTNPYGKRNATTSVSSAVVSLSPGWWYVENGAHNTAVTSYDGTNTTTFVAASANGYVFSDGTAQILNDATGGVGHYTQLLGGAP